MPRIPPFKEASSYGSANPTMTDSIEVHNHGPKKRTEILAFLAKLGFLESFYFLGFYLAQYQVLSVKYSDLSRVKDLSELKSLLLARVDIMLQKQIRLAEDTKRRIMNEEPIFPGIKHPEEDQ
jgi:hypothetical protein